MDSGYSYSTYSTLSVAIPLFLLQMGPMAIVLLIFLVFGFKWICCRKVCHKMRNDIIWTLCFKVLRPIYGDELKLDKEKNEFTLYERPMRKHKMLSLSIAVMGIFCCVFVSFWSEFLVSETDTCNKEMDCFALNATSGLPLGTQPLSFKNCTAYQEQDDEEFDIKCYFLAFDYVDAIGNSGGVLIIGALILTSQAILADGFLTLKDTSKRYGRVAASIFVCIQVVFGLLLIPLMVLLLIIPATRHSITSTNNSIVQFITYYFALSYAYMSTVYAFLFDWQWIKNCSRLNSRRGYVGMEATA